MQVGVFLSSLGIPDPLEALKRVEQLGIELVQIGAMDPKYYTSEFAARLKAALADQGIQASAVCAVYEGESYADMATVAQTVGLTNPDTLAARVAHTKRCVDFGAQVGVGILTTHIGVMPEDTGSGAYARLMNTVREIADYCRTKEMSFALETGQETADEMLTFVRGVGRPNLGVNFDPANMILYGTGGPIEAVGTLADHILHAHIKDGLYPAKKGQLGQEVPLGEGKVGIPQYIARLREIGYDGPLIIEREAGDDRVGDVSRGKALIQSLL